MPAPSLRTPLAGSLGLSLSLFAVGCSESAPNDAPIIDFVDSPVVVSAENGAYSIPMTIGFHDNDAEVVTRVRYRIPPAIDLVVDISGPLPTRQSADVTLVIPAGTSGNGDRRQVEITIIDGRGAESLPLPRTVTFE